jgi:hypothetical protein
MKIKIDWGVVAGHLDFLSERANWGGEIKPEEGQGRALRAIADRLRAGQRSLLLADEVGMGKTLIAAAFIESVRLAGGRAAVLIPPSLGAQWQTEIQRVRADAKSLLPLRSFQTFLQSYALPQNLSDRAAIQKRRRDDLKKRRLQRELPLDGSHWNDESILLLSHTFGRRIGAGPARTLLEAVRKTLSGTRRYRRDPRTGADHNVAREAADAIIGSLKYVADRRELQALLNDCQLDAGVKHIISRGLGRFDIVIIDEAHKARGADSLLSRVLGDMTWKSNDTFWLGLTATPVELGAGQWIDTLRRLAVPDDVLPSIEKAVWGYVDEVKRLRSREALTEGSVDQFQDTAASFQNALSPWVMRRDKREDPFLQNFSAKHGSHRATVPINVELGDMPLDWKRAFLATEALSLLQENKLTPAERRARLALPDGHNLDNEAEHRASDSLDAAIEGGMAKLARGQSAMPWSALATKIINGGSATIFSHPAILLAVREIEAAVVLGHKVLVFGKFTRPIRALTFLLDAREMVRRLCANAHPGNRWPQSSLGKLDDDRAAALDAALRDRVLNIDRLDRQALEQRLEDRAKDYSAARKSNLDKVAGDLREMSKSDRIAEEILSRWRPDDKESETSSALLLAALEDQRPLQDRIQPWTAEAIVKAYCSLIEEVAGGGDAEDAVPDAQARLKAHLQDFGGREGHFARLMDGRTAAQTRLLLQNAFNREVSWPRVLVAQSLVGREGLNLQGACRFVVMMHLEWNPAHAEQQIGRVDRIGSRWVREAEYFMRHDGSNKNAPRIEVRPIVVGGTYDAHHWRVLSQRWESMRAQLNGEVLPDIVCDHTDRQRQQRIDRVRRAAPDFTPRPIARAQPARE